MEYVFDNYFIVKNEEGNLGIINDKGNLVLDMKYESLQKIKGKNIIQGKEINKDIIEFYNSKIQKILESESPNIQIKEDFILISDGIEKIYLDNSGNKIEDTTNVKDLVLPEQIRDYTKKQTSIDNIYYSKQ